MIEYFLLGFQLSVYGFISGIFVNLFIGSSGLPYSLVSANPYGFYAICLAFPIILLFLLFYRNRFFIGHINQKSSSGFIYFSHWWRRAIPVSTVFLMCYYFFYAFTQDYRFFTIPFVVLFFMLAIFEIFDNPLTEEGEIYILVQSMISNSNNFEKVEFFWKKIAKRIEKKLRIGEIRVSRSDLVYYFSKRLLQTNDDLTNDLISIRNWLLGNQRSCYEALTHIIPKNKMKRFEEVQQPKALEEQKGLEREQQIEFNKLSNKLRRNWKVAVELVGFVASIATIITLYLMLNY